MTPTLLVTGGSGFIGANFIAWLLAHEPSVQVVNLDALTYAANPENTRPFEAQPRYRFVHGDIQDSRLLVSLFEQYRFSGIIHFAAESHVDNSISGPEAFIHTNVNGTFRLLEAARHAWLEGPHKPREGCQGSRFLHISTDEVYGSLGETGYFTELSPYAPNSPYSASKASSDMLVRSYYHTYGLNVVTTNCSNNYGPLQHDEKLIPTIIRSALAAQPIPIYGDGRNVRDWLYVADHCAAVWLAWNKGVAGETYAVGGDNERQNIELATTICGILDRKKPRSQGSYADLITHVTDRPGHDRRYAIDATKIKKQLGWRPQETFHTGMEKTTEFYLKKYT